jgi:hypothetical protein
MSIFVFCSLGRIVACATIEKSTYNGYIVTAKNAVALEFPALLDG